MLDLLGTYSFIALVGSLGLYITTWVLEDLARTVNSIKISSICFDISKVLDKLMKYIFISLICSVVVSGIFVIMNEYRSVFNTVGILILSIFIYHLGSIIGRIINYYSKEG